MSYENIFLINLIVRKMILDSVETHEQEFVVDRPYNLPVSIILEDVLIYTLTLMVFLV